MYRHRWTEWSHTSIRYWILETITTGLQVNGVPLGHSLAFCRKLVE